MLCGYEYSVVPQAYSVWYGPGYVRNEDQRVLFRTSTDCFEPERVMYDFSASIGDTLEIGMSEIDGYNRLFVVDTIETIITTGGPRRRFMLWYQDPFGDGDPFCYPMYWIEGIGSTTHPFFPLTCLWDGCESYWALTCVDSLETPVYRSSPGVACHQNIAIDERSDANEWLTATMSPNGFLQLMYPASFERGEIRVMDASGRAWSIHPVSRDQTSISLPSIAAGVYHLWLSDLEGRRWTTRWVSTH
ncbi:MAG: hypothetical protein IPL52_13410 [Flavobacteriales bacterium]|nr:hypothetical protein [Flavobacteriales bacterium]